MPSYLLFTLHFCTTNFILNLSNNTMDISFRCMVYGNAFYISVVAPVAAIIVKNTIILIVVLIRLHRRSKRKPINVLARVITEARRAFGFNILLGTTWVLAFFAVEDVTMIFQWLLCITNSLQGFFIFFFHIVRNQDVRNAWSEAFGKNTSSKLSHQKATKNAKEIKKKARLRLINLGRETRL